MAYEQNLPGKTTIAPDVLHTIARLSALNIDGVSHMSSVPSGKGKGLFKRGTSEGVVIDIQDGVVFADLYLILKNGYNIREVSRQIQREVARAISEMVGMQVGRVNIHVEDIEFPTEVEA
ncbi:MAG: Asp23/Gls24 family envelope stress response protein [Chloroflexi bacterium]|nr:MAG: Asp23/Gls24 family envelope stress response protein [Chloroflexota bacterium]